MVKDISSVHHYDMLCALRVVDSRVDTLLATVSFSVQPAGGAKHPVFVINAELQSSFSQTKKHTSSVYQWPGSKGILMSCYQPNLLLIV